MRRKTIIITIILFITIILIGIVKLFIKRDITQTQDSRLDFFSENLNLQKTNILQSFQNYASFVVDEIQKDKELSSLLNSLRSSDSVQLNETTNELKNKTDVYIQKLSQIGFYSLSFIYKNKKNNYLEFTNNKNKCETQSFNYYQILNENLNTAQFSGFSISNTYTGYRFLFKLYPNNKKNIPVFVEMGIEYKQLKKIINQNIPGNRIGYLVYHKSKEPEKQILNNFIEVGENESLYINDEDLSYLSSKIHKKQFNKIISKIEKAVLYTHADNFSIYLNTGNKPEAISFSTLNSLKEDTDIYLVSIYNDHMLDKTNDWSNQIFIINLIIILLIMFGILYLVINHIDLIKEKKFILESEKKLIEMNRSKDKFFSILAHDLKNPFNGIMGMSGYLNENYYEIDDNERKDVINDINISSKNAFNLLQNLLEWTRAQSGQIKNIPVLIEPANIIEISLETVMNLAKNKEIEIIKSIETDRNGYADENLVSTVLRNLFTNAVKFSPRHSSIEVIVKQYNNELIFCVKDAGIGLTSEEIDKLFRIDTNFHKKGTENEIGTGLGLKICKEFIEYCNGRIWVISEPSVGSSFYFTIPVYK